MNKLDRKGILRQVIESKWGVYAKLRGIEIGCLSGEVDGFLLKEFPNLYMVTIDPSPIWPDVFKNCASYLSRLRIMNMTSDEAVKLLKREYDFVFIDGDHSYEQCRNDIYNCLTLLKKGGIMFGHNLDKGQENDAHPGVLQAVYETFAKDRVHTGDDVMWWIYV